MLVRLQKQKANDNTTMLPMGPDPSLVLVSLSIYDTKTAMLDVVGILDCDNL